MLTSILKMWTSVQDTAMVKTLLCAVVVLMLMRWLTKKKYKLPPGPRPLPLLGNILSFRGAPFESVLSNWYKTYGPVVTFYLENSRMSAPPPPPPTYNESMQQQGYPVGGAYQQTYGSVNPPPAGAYQPPPPAAYPPPTAPAGNYPPPGAYDPNKGAYHPQAGYPGPAMPPGSYQQSTQSSTNIVVQQSQPVVVVGGCPACRVGVLEDDFTCCGVCCAILFFPLGILCCLAMRQRRCAHCGAVFG